MNNIYLKVIKKNKKWLNKKQFSIQVFVIDFYTQIDVHWVDFKPRENFGVDTKGQSDVYSNFKQSLINQRVPHLKPSKCTCLASSLGFLSTIHRTEGKALHDSDSCTFSSSNGVVCLSARHTKPWSFRRLDEEVEHGHRGTAFDLHADLDHLQTKNGT